MKNSSFDKKACFTLKLISFFTTTVSVVMLVFIIGYVIFGGADKITLALLFGDGKQSPSVLPALAGTVRLIFIAIIIAVPLGIGSAIYLAEYSNKSGGFVKIVRIATETLAGIPSIVYGLFGYLVFVVAFKMGYTILGGGITLAVMILPVIVRSTEESLLSVPDSLREGSYALGAGKARTIFTVVLPSCAGGIVTAIILSVGRVISESAVLILTIGMVVNKMPSSALSPGTSLALDIYYFASHGYPSEAAATGVVLMVLVLIVNGIAALAGKLIARKTGEVL